MVIDFGWFETTIGISTNMLAIIVLFGFKNSSPIFFGGICFNDKLITGFWYLLILGDVYTMILVV